MFGIVSSANDATLFFYMKETTIRDLTFCQLIIIKGYLDQIQMKEV
jgi:hypothetical protein